MVHDGAATGYRRQSGAYSAGRPSYPETLIARFVDRFGRDDVVELGAGTGIFTRQLVAAGCQPVAIEPVAEMRAALQESLPQITALDGTAERTGLADLSADTVVVAQAFHWFDHRAALAEIRRILRPGGHLVCCWNVRDESVPWVAEWTHAMDRHAGDTPRHRTMHWRRAIEDIRNDDGERSVVLVDDVAMANPWPTNRAGVVARARSTSFIAALDQPTQTELLDEIAGLVAPLGERFDFPYRSEMQAWQLTR